VCGGWRPVQHNQRLGAEICEPCYRARAQPTEACSICGRDTTVKARTTDDKPICTSCYRKHRASWEPRTTHGNHAAALLELRVIARERGGWCTSRRYLHGMAPLRWKCREGHRWSATPASIKRGSWCRRCAGLAPVGLVEMRRMAKERGGMCLSDTYVNLATSMT